MSQVKNHVKNVPDCTIPCQNVSLGICRQQRVSSVYGFAHFDQVLCCPQKQSLDTIEFSVESNCLDDTLLMYRMMWICTFCACLKALFSSPVRKYRKSYCTTPGVCVGMGGGGGINKNVKVFMTLYFLNPEMDFVYIWYDYRCWPKILWDTIHTPAYDLEFKIYDL